MKTLLNLALIIALLLFAVPMLAQDATEEPVPTVAPTEEPATPPEVTPVADLPAILLGLFSVPVAAPLLSFLTQKLKPYVSFSPVLLNLALAFAFYVLYVLALQFQLVSVYDSTIALLLAVLPVVWAGGSEVVYQNVLKRA